MNGAEWRTRTADPRITNALLYQLSQFGIKQNNLLSCSWLTVAKVQIFYDSLQVFTKVFLILHKF